MCHSRRHHRSAATTPRRDPALRASDAEREAVVAELREHGGAGRLDVEELEQRVGAAYGARTNGDLERLLSDLPARRRAVVEAPRHGAMAWHGHGWSSFLATNLLLLVIWAATGAGHFWPGWVMLWWGLALAMKSGPRLVRLR